jgi:hypothetical protein
MMRKMALLPEKLRATLQNLEPAHSRYLSDETFGGPSLHFHLTSLRAAEEDDFDRFAEQVYALLTAWGMHRMGPGGAKMKDFAPFRASLLGVIEHIRHLRGRSPGDLSPADWNQLETVFTSLRCMESGASLVGNSKIMAHCVPNLIPPVDRSYTLKFLIGGSAIPNDPDVEWAVLCGLLHGYFYPMIADPAFIERARQWMTGANRSPWDSSPLKVADNVLIGHMRMSRPD